MILTDTHTHLYVEEFKEDCNAMMTRAIEAGIKRFFLPNIDASTINSLNDIHKAYPQNCFPMMGLHPCSVLKDYKTELETIKNELDTGNYCAVGEIGLDYHWDLTFKDQQIEAFKEQIEWAKEKKLPIAIHCRESFEDIVMVLKDLKDDNLRGVFHCFSGTINEARQVIGLGFYMGIGGVLTFKNSGLDKVISEIDIKHLIMAK